MRTSILALLLSLSVSLAQGQMFSQGAAFKSVVVPKVAAIAYPTDWETNWTGGTYNGSSQYDAIVSPPYCWTSNAFSISLWAMTSDITHEPSGNSQTFLNIYKDANNMTRLGEDAGAPAGRLFVSNHYGSAGERGKETTSVTFDNNVWVHVVITYSGATNVTIYTNSVIAAVAANSYSIGNTSQIGAKTTTAGFWQGSVSKVRVYDRYLTATEISALWAEGH
jgi:hypothetical protein